MSEVPLSEARYRKPSPPHWDELNTFANESIDAGHSPEAVVHNIWDRLSVLDLEGVDRIRYRGLGTITCSVVRPLADEQAQDKFVDDAVNIFVESHPAYCKHPNEFDEHVSTKRGLYIGEVASLHSDVIGEQPTIRASYDALLPGTKLLTDTALVAATFGVQKRLTTLNSYHLGRILKSDLAYQSVVDNFSGGASMVLALELCRRYAQKYQQETDRPYTDRTWKSDATLLVKEAVSCKELQNLNNLDKVAKIAAGIRLDEVEMSNLYDLVRIDRPDGIYIDPKDIPRKPLPVDRDRESLSRLPHEARLQCPARPIDGAVALAVKLTTRIVSEAQHQLLGPRHGWLEKLRLAR